MIRGDVTVALLLLLAVMGCRQLVRISSPSQPTLKVDAEVRALIDLVNEHRDDIGCKPLAWSTPIAEVAQRHASDMTHRNFFGHTNPDGSNPFQRLQAAGIRYSKAAENIASGQPTASQVFQSWLSSPGHRRNIEDCTFREHGIGFAPGAKSIAFGGVTYAWTHNFALLRP